MSEAITISTNNCDVKKARVLTIQEKLENTKALITSAENDYKNIKLANDFINKCIVTDTDTDEVTAKAFIKKDVAEAFHFTGKSGSDIVNDLIKDYNQMHKKYLKLKEFEAKKDILAIDKEFEGLYTIKPNGITGDLMVLPHYYNIAEEIIKNLHVITYKDNIYLYKDGQYIENKGLVEAEATRILNGILLYYNSKGITNNLRDVMTNIRTYSPCLEYPFQGVRNAINVNNGVIVFDKNGDLHFEEPDPEKYKFNYKLAVKYKPEAESTWVVDQLKKYSDRYEAILQIIAQALVQSMGYSPSKLAYLFIGPADYGKSTVLENIIMALFGKPLCCGVSLNKMSSDSNNRFQLSPLEGKLLNIKDELSYFKMSDSETFKMVTGSYDIDIERKGVDPYKAISTAVHVFAANNTPSFDSRVKMDDAFWKRWVIIPCTKTHFTRDDSFKHELLKEENQSGLLNEVLKIVSNHLKGNAWKYTNAYGDDWETVREEWLQLGHPLYKFISENMIRGEETAIRKDQMLSAVCDWCDKHLLYSKAKPNTVNDLTDTIKVCNGTVDEKRTFFIRTQEEIEALVARREMYDTKAILLTERYHCYVLPWTWKETSEYKNKFSKNIKE